MSKVKCAAGILLGMVIGFIGHYVYDRLRYPLGRIRTKEFKPLEDEL